LRSVAPYRTGEASATLLEAKDFSVSADLILEGYLPQPPLQEKKSGAHIQVVRMACRVDGLSRISANRNGGPRVSKIRNKNGD
jgi:hypothetical protein